MFKLYELNNETKVHNSKIKVNQKGGTLEVDKHYDPDVFILTGPSSLDGEVSLINKTNYILEFLDYLKNEKLYTYDTIINYQIDLKQFQKYADRLHITISTANKDAIENFFLSLHSLGMSSSSLARKASTLRSYYSYLLKSSIITSTPMIGIKTPKLSKKLPNVLSISDVDTLCSISTNSVVARRDKAIIEVMYSSALRLSELSNLNIDSVDTLSKYVKVVGKGKKREYCH